MQIFIIKEIKEMQNSQSQESRAYLLLIFPAYQGKKLNQASLQLLKKSTQITIQFDILVQTSGQIQQLLLKFPSLPDAIDFHFELKQHLSYLQAIMKPSLEDFTADNIPKFSGFPIEEQLDVEGFQYNQGRLKLKRKTSLDEIFDKQICHNDQSTVVNTALTLESFQDIQQSTTVKKKQIIKPLAQIILCVGFIYGIYKIASNI